jgi:hypothetical protein
MHPDDTARTLALSRLTARTEFGDCWRIVTGFLNERYPLLHFAGRQRRTHVIAWFLATGAWPQNGQHVCHVCDDPVCWKNDEIGTYELDGVSYPRRGHLWLGTATANHRDADLKGHRPVGATHWMRQKPDLIARGDRHQGAKLTEQAVREIRRRHAAGESRKSLALAYGTHPTNILYVVRGKTWKHVE